MNARYLWKADTRGILFRRKGPEDCVDTRPAPVTEDSAPLGLLSWRTWVSHHDAELVIPDMLSCDGNDNKPAGRLPDTVKYFVRCQYDPVYFLKAAVYVKTTSHWFDLLEPSTRPHASHYVEERLQLNLLSYLQKYGADTHGERLARLMLEASPGTVFAKVVEIEFFSRVPESTSSPRKSGNPLGVSLTWRDNWITQQIPAPSRVMMIPEVFQIEESLSNYYREVLRRLWINRTNANN